MTKYHKIQCISSLWFQPGTWNPFFTVTFAKVCWALVVPSHFSTKTSAPWWKEMPSGRLHGLQTMELCRSYVAAMSHWILIKWSKRGHKWFSNPLDIFEHVWNWSSPCDEIGSWLWGAHRAAQRHPSSGRRPGAEGWDCFSMTCPLHRSTGAPWVIPRSHTCLPGSVSDSIWLNDVAICWLMMWDDVGLYSYTIPHIGITRIHDRNSEELRGTWVAPHFALWGTTQYLTWSL